MLRIVLLPLDNRPLNYASIKRTAAVSPVELILPPRGLVSGREGAPELIPVARWLMSNCEGNALVLSLDALLHGGLVQARAARPAAPRALEALKVLAPLSARAASIRAFFVWKRVWGSIFTLRGLARMPVFQQVSIRLAELARESDAYSLYARLASQPEPLCGLPADDVSLLAQSRLAMLDEAKAIIHACASEGITLHIAVEDSIANGVQEEELTWLRSNSDAPFTIADGADEAGAVLVSGAIKESLANLPLNVYADSSLDVIAPYESRTVVSNLRVLCLLAGAGNTQEPSDAILHITGQPEASDLYTDLVAGKITLAEPEELLERLIPAEDISRRVFCDLTATNGINPPLLQAFAKDRTPPLAIAQVNTISNRIGHALLLAVIASEAAPSNELTQLIISSYLEDLLYQAHLRTWALSKYGGIEPESDAVCAEAEHSLSLLATAFAQRKFNGALLFGKRIKAGCVSVRLPWKRWFECEVEVEASLV